MNKQEAIGRIENIDTLNINDMIAGQQVDMVIKNQVLDIISQIHEPSKVVVPKFVATWIEEAKEEGYNLSYAMSDDITPSEVEEWLFKHAYSNEEVFAQAWLDGYEVEKEQLYTVKVVGTGQYLVERFKKQGYVFIDTEDPLLFTKSELEAAGFRGVFDNPMFEVEEVE
ncbi:TPA: DUF1642 domain-containing protein [Streptococcus suis]